MPDDPTTSDAELEAQRRRFRHRADLVLAGGGVKGIAHIGALRALQDHGYRVHPRIAGTSVGAIIGAVLATGGSVDDAETALREFDFRSVRADPAYARTDLGGLAAIRLHGGRFSGDRVTDWLRELLGPQLTFGELRRARRAPADRPPLVVLATDVTNGRLVQFPRDFERVYGLDADAQLVFPAVRASISIPLFFAPFGIEPVGAARPGATPLQGTRFVDGGVLSNFAVDVLDRAPTADLDQLRPRWPTFGLTLMRGDTPADVGHNLAQAIARVPPIALGPLGELTDALVGTLVVGQDEDRSSRWWMTRRTIRIDTRAHGIVDFDISPEGKQELLDRGAADATAFLNERWKVLRDGEWRGGDGRAYFPLPDELAGPPATG